MDPPQIFACPRSKIPCPFFICIAAAKFVSEIFPILVCGAESRTSTPIQSKFVISKNEFFFLLEKNIEPKVLESKLSNAKEPIIFGTESWKSSSKAPRALVCPIVKVTLFIWICIGCAKK